MKKINILITGFIVLAGLIYLSSCEERLPQDYTPYNPTPVTASNINLDYPPAEFYPQPVVLASDTPTFKIDGVYTFRIDTATTSGGSFVLNNFDIDKETGVITYDNTNGSLTPGDYAVDVSVSNTNGLAKIPQAFTFKVLSVPISISVDNPIVDAGALQEGVIATVSYTDDSGGDIAEVTYSLDPEITGFAIDPASGEISKTSEAETGKTHMLSVRVVTNLGSVTFTDVVTVNVGPPPTIQFVQQDGSTPLVKVTVSPWSSYTSQPPVLTGMESSGGWELILADTVAQELKDAMSIGADGSVTISADGNIPEGDYWVGAKATNGSGISFEFPAQFTVHVEKRWESSPVFFEDFNNTTTTPEDVNAYNSALSSNVQNGGHITGLFKAVKTENTSKDQMFQTAKMSENKIDGGFANHFETTLTIELAIGADWRDLRVSFNDMFGYGNNRLDWYSRTLGWAYSNADVVAGIYDPANWNILMADNDPDWASSAGTGQTGARDSDFNKVPPKEFGGIDPAQPMVYVTWWVGKVATATKGAVFHFDDLKVEVSTAFAAEEE